MHFLAPPSSWGPEPASCAELTRRNSGGRQGGNDYEIFEDERTVGHTVTCPEDTIKLLNDLFLGGK